MCTLEPCARLKPNMLPLCPYMCAAVCGCHPQQEHHEHPNADHPGRMHLRTRLLPRRVSMQSLAAWVRHA